jgi:enterochelin esterase-like enzyme
MRREMSGRVLPTLTLLAILLTACSSPALAGVAASPVATATASPPAPTSGASPLPIVTLVLTRSLPPTSTASPTLGPTTTPLCTETRGAVVSEQFTSTLLSRSIKMRVYLPPCYKAETWRVYPVLYLIHGLHMNEKTWDELGADEAADELIAGGEVPPFIVVMPRAPDDDRFTEAFVTELAPYIDAQYRTDATREGRAIGGMSRGGGWTARIGLQHPELFGALGFHSPAIFYADEDQAWRWLNALPEGLRPRIYIDIGQADANPDSAQWLDTALTERGIDHEYHLNPGGHTATYWTTQLPEYLRWYASAW